MEEIWKAVEGYEGYYEVSNLGRARSLDRKGKHSTGTPLNLKGKLISLKPTTRLGYVMVSLCKDGIAFKDYLHRLVALAFIPNPEKLSIINHKDGNKSNNHVDNLEWCSRAYNVHHAYATGLINNSGEKHYKARQVINCRGEVFPTCVAAANHYRISNYTNVWRACKQGDGNSGRYSDGVKIKWRYKDKPVDK